MEKSRNLNSRNSLKISDNSLRTKTINYNEIFINKRVFIYTENNLQDKRLENVLIKLKAEILHSFDDKVNYVIASNKKLKKDCNELTLKESNLAPLARNSMKENIVSAREPVVSIYGLRTRKMISNSVKAIKDNNSNIKQTAATDNVCDFITRVRNMGITILSLENVWKWVLGLPASLMEDNIVHEEKTKFDRSRVLKEIREPGMKILDQSGLYKPEFIHNCNFNAHKWTETRATDMPNNVGIPSIDNSSSKMIPNAANKVALARKSSRSTKPVANGAKLAPKNPNAGYCECCNVKYEHVVTHIECSQHSLFANDASNFADIDKFLEQYKDFDAFFDIRKKKQKALERIHRGKLIKTLSANDFKNSKTPLLRVATEPISPLTQLGKAAVAAVANNAIVVDVVPEAALANSGDAMDIDPPQLPAQQPPQIHWGVLTSTEIPEQCEAIAINHEEECDQRACVSSQEEIPVLSPDAVSIVGVVSQCVASVHWLLPLLEVSSPPLVPGPADVTAIISQALPDCPIVAPAVRQSVPPLLPITVAASWDHLFSQSLSALSPLVSPVKLGSAEFDLGFAYHEAKAADAPIIEEPMSVVVVSDDKEDDDDDTEGVIDDDHLSTSSFAMGSSIGSSIARPSSIYFQPDDSLDNSASTSFLSPVISNSRYHAFSPFLLRSVGKQSSANEHDFSPRFDYSPNRYEHHSDFDCGSFDSPAIVAAAAANQRPILDNDADAVIDLRQMTDCDLYHNDLFNIFSTGKFLGQPATTDPGTSSSKNYFSIDSIVQKHFQSRFDLNLCSSSSASLSSGSDRNPPNNNAISSSMITETTTKAPMKRGRPQEDSPIGYSPNHKRPRQRNDHDCNSKEKLSRKKRSICDRQDSESPVSRRPFRRAKYLARESISISTHQYFN